MGFFSYLQDMDQQDPNVAPPVGKKIRQAGKDYSLRDQTQTPDDSFNLPASEADNVRQDDPAENKLKVKTAHTDIASAFGDAIKVLSQAPQSSANVDPEGTAFGMYDNADQKDLENALTTAQRRDNPIKLADDLRVIASRKTMQPEYATKLFAVADKLTKAYKAQGELEAMRQPGGPLSVSPQEVEGRKKWVAEQIAKTEGDLKTSGSLRSPALQKSLGDLRAEEGRINLATQQPPRDAAVPAPSPENPAGTKPIEGNFNALGIKKPQMMDAYVKALEALGLDSTSLDQTVPFDTGLLRVMSTLDPQATVARRAVADPDLQSQPSQGDTAKPGDITQRSPEQYELESKKQRVRQLYQELGTSPFGNTWLGLISYVLLGMLMGPKMAARILSRRNDGALRGEIEYLKGEIRDEMVRRDRSAKEQEDYRKMYVQHYLTSQRQTDDDRRTLRRQLLLTHIRGQQALERAKMTKREQQDSTLKSLEDSFSTYKSMASSRAQETDYDGAKKWNDKAEEVLELIMNRKSQLRAEELSAQEPKE